MMRLLVTGLMMAGCGVTPAPSDAVLVSADEQSAVSSSLSGAQLLGSTLTTTGNLNLRTGPGTTYSIRTVMPLGAEVTVVDATPSNGFYNVKYNALVGWASGSYLVASAPSGGLTVARAAAVERAKSGVGYSYWWGHGKWTPWGLSDTGAGTCTGDCPNCTHGGSSGADCSGYVGKIWQVPSTNSDPRVDSHPYSTATFVGTNSQWSTVSRSALKAGDALVYNTNGAGHIFLYESGDGWGSMWAYEAKGCVAGIVHDLRTADSTFKAIARTGY
jgi:uncharacterized protein YraI